MISYGKHTIDQSDIKAVIDVLKSDFLTQGPVVESFESELINSFGPGYCTAVSNGTAALHIVGMALGWGSEDIVLTSPLTFLATSNAVLYCGATPDFCDINFKDYTIDPIKLEEKIISYKKRGKKVRAIIGVDFAGHPCNWKDLRKIADTYDINLVNDNCHAIGASYKKKLNYALKYADAVTHSYHPVKPFTTGEGGAILTKNKKLDSKIKELRSHGVVRDQNKMKMEGSWFYEMNSLGYNYRLTDIQAALGLSQLRRLDKFILKRRKIASFYDKSLKGEEFFMIPEASRDVIHSYHLYPLLIDFSKYSINKIEMFNQMRKKGINLQVHYIPVHLQPYYKKRFGFKVGDYPVAEEFYKKEVSLPIFPLLLKKDQKFVLDCINEVMHSKK